MSLIITRDACTDNSLDSKESPKLDSMTLILFGATGDLAKRKIYPALFNLYLDGKLPNSFSVMGLGRRSWSDNTFQSHVMESINHFSRRPCENKAIMDKFLQSFCYQAFDATNAEGYKTLLKKVKTNEEKLNIPQNRLFYLSVAPEFINKITKNIKESGLGQAKGWKRLIIEKPFGHDLESARVLNKRLSQSFEEDEIYRIDHYLGKPMVQNLEALKFANPVIRALWSNQHVANIQITANETVGVEDRAGYYDQAGAIRDMFQNHLLQLLMMISMNVPEKTRPDVITNEKIKMMESLRPLKKEDVVRNVIRGQYHAGEILGQQVVGYRDEAGVDDYSLNDTFIAARLWIDHESWKGVPFFIRTGKRMKEKSTKIVIEFKDDYDTNLPNQMVISINPEEAVSLQLNMKNPFSGDIEPVTVDYSSKQKSASEAYEPLLLNALSGDSTFFAHWREVELSWQWVQPVLEAFEEQLIPLHSYESGSFGPEASDYLIREDGFNWW